MRHTLIATLVAAAAASTVVLAPPANASGCEQIPWGFLGSQRRAICDGPIRPDGSWLRHRIVGVPAHYAAATSSCYGGYSYSSCTYYPGGYIAEYDVSDETYVVTPDTVLPDEPGHLL